MQCVWPTTVTLAILLLAWYNLIHINILNRLLAIFHAYSNWKIFFKLNWNKFIHFQPLHPNSSNINCRAFEIVIVEVILSKQITVWLFFFCAVHICHDFGQTASSEHTTSCLFPLSFRPGLKIIFMDNFCTVAIGCSLQAWDFLIPSSCNACWCRQLLSACFVDALCFSFLSCRVCKQNSGMDPYRYRN